MAKLRALLPPQQLSSVEQMLSTISVDVPARAQRTPLLETLMEAAQQGRWVRVTYQSAERFSTQHLLPRQLHMRNGYWYCDAFSYEHEEERIYRVDRFRAVEPVSPTFQPAPLPEALPYDHPSHPEVVVTLSARGVAHIESEPHIGQRVRRNDDGTGDLTFRCPPSELNWFARDFAGLGADAVVHAPAELRARLKRLGEKLVEQYEKR